MDEPTLTANEGTSGFMGETALTNLKKEEKPVIINDNDPSPQLKALLNEFFLYVFLFCVVAFLARQLHLSPLYLIFILFFIFITYIYIKFSAYR